MSRVWTFVIRGGAPFAATEQFTPTLRHDGGPLTLWKMVGTDTRAAEVAAAIRAHTGASVEYHTETQSEEQLAERLALLGVGDEP